MIKKQIVEEIMNKTGINKMEVSGVVEALMQTIIDAVANGETVYLRGFGKFYPLERKPKSVRNFSTDQQYTKDVCKRPKFRPYDPFIEAINK